MEYKLYYSLGIGAGGFTPFLDHVLSLQMKKTVLLLLTFLAMDKAMVFSQSLSPSEQKELQERYFGNLDLMQADKLYWSGKGKEAQSLYASARRTFQAQKNWEAYIRSSSSLAKSLAGGETFEEGVTIAKESIRLIEAQAPAYKKYCNRIYHSLSAIYQWAGQAEHSLPYAHQSLLCLRAQDANEEDATFGYYYNGLGTIHRDIGDLDSALYYFKQGLQVLQKGTNQKDFEYARTYEHLGALHATRGNFDKAIEDTEKGLKIASEAQSRSGLQLVYFYLNLGSFYSDIGEYAQSTDYFRKVIYTIETSGTTKARYREKIIPFALLGMGHNHLALGELEEASIAFDKAGKTLQGKQSLFDLQLRAIIGKGQVQVQKGDVTQALQYLQEAEELFEQSASKLPNNIRYIEVQASIQRKLGDIYKLQKKWDSSLFAYKEALQLNFTGGDTDLYRTGPGTYQSIAGIFEAKEQLDSALLYNQKALQLATYGNEDSPLEDLSAGQSIGSSLVTYSILNQRANLLLQLAAHAKDLPSRESLEAEVLSVYSFADQVHLQNLRKINLLRGAQSKALIERSLTNYQDALAFTTELYERRGDRRFLEKSFFFTQKMKAQQLWLSSLNSQAVSYGNVPSERLREERDLQHDIHYYENKVREARAIQDSVALAKYQYTYLLESRKRYSALVRKIEQENPDYYASKYAFQPETEEGLQALLQQDELLIEYVFADSVIYAYTMGHGQAMEVYKIPLLDQTTSQIQDLHQLLQKTSWIRRSKREKFIQLSHQLYQQFIAPLAAQINGKSRLIIIGDGITNYIPFEVLLSSDTFSPFTALNYLIRQFTISYHYSSSLFAQARRKERDRSTAGIFAFAPVYDKTSGSDLALGEVLTEESLRAIKEGHFSPLPESEKEVKTIVQLFEQKGSNNNLLALRQDAYEGALKHNLEQNFTFLHIAGHSFANVEQPKFSGIACAETKRQDEDGILYSGEIHALNTQADLITLSSCESGYGKLDRTEGLLGLNRAFIYTGVPNVVFSLWKVYDKVSAQLMVDFYAKVLDGKDYGIALREAKLKLLNQEATAAPHYWSPYLLIGR